MTTVHKIGMSFRKPTWKFELRRCRGLLGLWVALAARGQAKLTSIAPPYSKPMMLTTQAPACRA